MLSAKSLAFSALLTGASAAVQGFNYGAQGGSSGVKVEADYQTEFEAALSLSGTDGNFNSARLYTMCQGGTTDPIEAIPAAMKTNTTLLLGLWASAGDEAFATQAKCLENAIEMYPEAGSLIVGISVGSEDLYRITPTALENSKMDGAEPPVGADAATITGYIKDVRSLVKGTPYESPIGHVDTWSVWVDGANKDVVEACDWIGYDGYPYWEKEHTNDISNGRELFKDSLDKTRAACPGKEIWITETGWPTAGATVGDAEASPENAQQYWQDVGCSLFGVTNTWWFTLQGLPDGSKEPSWGVLNADLDPTPVFDLSCKGVETVDFEAQASTSGNSTTSSSGSGSSSSGSSSSSDSSSTSTSEDGSPAGNGSGAATTGISVVAVFLAAAGAFL